MALSATVQPFVPANGPPARDGAIIVPTGVVSDWVWVCNAPATADNGGDDVVSPLAITRAAIRKLRAGGSGTTLLLCLKYDDGATVSVNPVVQPFGIDANGVPHRLRDSLGNHALALAAGETDVQDGTYKYTDPVEVDMDGCTDILVAVKTALAVSAGSTNGAQILAKLK